MTFDPTSVEVLCVTLPKDHCVQVPWKYIKVCGYSDLFCKKNLNQRSLTLDDLWPHICWGHMCDSTQGSFCPSPMKIHQSMWIQWTFLLKLEPKVIDPRWPLTPHLLRSHVWLCPRIIVSKCHGNTSMYVDTVINFAKITTYIHTHTTYILHTTYRISDHIVSFWTTFRRDKKVMDLKCWFWPYG